MASTQVYRSYADFKKRPDKRGNGVSPRHAADHPGYRRDNCTNEGCWDCADCTDCRDCSVCRGQHGAVGAELLGADD